MARDLFLDHDNFMDNIRRIPESQDRGKGRPKTTWHKDPSKWGPAEFIAAVDLGPHESYVPKPKGYRRSETIPVHPMWKENLFILTHAFPPLMVHQLGLKLADRYLPRKYHKFKLPAAVLFYQASFTHFAVNMVKRMHYWVAHYGTFDEENRGRDMIPDSRVRQLAIGVTAYVIVRMTGVFAFAWDKRKKPLSGLSWKTPIKMGAWIAVMDYLFYAYHRTCHQVPWAWSIHKGHHMTKHPSAIQSILADEVQEIIEIGLIPAGATLAVPLNFPELNLMAFYMIYVEAMGHSGIRAYWGHPLIGAVLKPFGLDLAIEDHDIHHRYGRSGQNFGKATRIWDRLFGTCNARIETVEGTKPPVAVAKSEPPATPIGDEAV